MTWPSLGVGVYPEAPAAPRTRISLCHLGTRPTPRCRPRCRRGSRPCSPSRTRRQPESVGERQRAPGPFGRRQPALADFPLDLGQVRADVVAAEKAPAQLLFQHVPEPGQLLTAALLVELAAGA